MRIVAIWFGRIATGALWLSGLGLVLMTAFTAWQVWGRFVMNDSPSWTEPASILMMAWFILLGSAVGVREGYHLGFDILLIAVPEGVRKVLTTISDVAVTGFGAAMAWYGYLLAAGTWASTSPALGIPVGVGYTPLIVGGVLIVLFSLERILRRLAGLEGTDDDALLSIDTAA